MTEHAMAKGKVAAPGLIQRGEVLNALLAEAHEATARIVGLSPRAEEGKEPDKSLVGRLENELDRALRSLESLVEQLRAIEGRFGNT